MISVNATDTEEKKIKAASAIVNDALEEHVEAREMKKIEAKNVVQIKQIAIEELWKEEEVQKKLAAEKEHGNDEEERLLERFQRGDRVEVEEKEVNDVVMEQSDWKRGVERKAEAAEKEEDEDANLVGGEEVAADSFVDVRVSPLERKEEVGLFIETINWATKGQQQLAQPQALCSQFVIQKEKLKAAVFGLLSRGPTSVSLALIQNTKLTRPEPKPPWPNPFLNNPRNPFSPTHILIA